MTDMNNHITTNAITIDHKSFKYRRILSNMNMVMKMKVTLLLLLLLLKQFIV